MRSKEFNEIAVHISENAMNEHEAIKGYTILLNKVKECNGDPKDIPVIEELISDEIQHAHVLKKLYHKYTKIEEAAD